MIKKIKQSPAIRGLYELWKHYLSIRKRSFGYIGENVLIIPPLKLSNPKNIFLYENTKITDAVILTTNAKFIMKKYSAAAEGLKVSTGGHKLELGKFYRTVRKDVEDVKLLDKDVIVEEDVWIGMNVTLTSGVTIGRGATLGAGAIVTKDVPPYCLAAGAPAKFIKWKWTIEEIIEHEAGLYPADERISRERLEEYHQKYSRFGK